MNHQSASQPIDVDIPAPDVVSQNECSCPGIYTQAWCLPDSQSQSVTQLFSYPLRTNDPPQPVHFSNTSAFHFEFITDTKTEVDTITPTHNGQLGNPQVVSCNSDQSVTMVVHPIISFNFTSSSQPVSSTSDSASPRNPINYPHTVTTTTYNAVNPTANPTVTTARTQTLVSPLPLTTAYAASPNSSLPSYIEPLLIPVAAAIVPQIGLSPLPPMAVTARHTHDMMLETVVEELGPLSDEDNSYEPSHSSGFGSYDTEKSSLLSDMLADDQHGYLDFPTTENISHNHFDASLGTALDQQHNDTTPGLSEQHDIARNVQTASESTSAPAGATPLLASQSSLPLLPSLPSPTWQSKAVIADGDIGKVDGDENVQDRGKAKQKSRSRFTRLLSEGDIPSRNIPENDISEQSVTRDDSHSYTISNSESWDQTGSSLSQNPSLGSTLPSLTSSHHISTKYTLYSPLAHAIDPDLPISAFLHVHAPPPLTALPLLSSLAAWTTRRFASMHFRAMASSAFLSPQWLTQRHGRRLYSALTVLADVMAVDTMALALPVMCDEGLSQSVCSAVWGVDVARFKAVLGNRGSGAAEGVSGERTLCGDDMEQQSTRSARVFTSAVDVVSNSALTPHQNSANTCVDAKGHEGDCHNDTDWHLSWSAEQGIQASAAPSPFNTSSATAAIGSASESQNNLAPAMRSQSNRPRASIVSSSKSSLSTSSQSHTETSNHLSQATTQSTRSKVAQPKAQPPMYPLGEYGRGGASSMLVRVPYTHGLLGDVAVPCQEYLDKEETGVIPVYLADVKTGANKRSDLHRQELSEDVSAYGDDYDWYDSIDDEFYVDDADIPDTCFCTDPSRCTCGIMAPDSTQCANGCVFDRPLDYLDAQEECAIYNYCHLHCYDELDATNVYTTVNETGFVDPYLARHQSQQQSATEPLFSLDAVSVTDKTNAAITIAASPLYSPHITSRSRVICPSADITGREVEHVVEAIECVCDHILQLRQVYLQRVVYLDSLQVSLLAPFTTLCVKHRDELLTSLEKKKAQLSEIKSSLSTLCEDVEGLKLSINKGIELGLSGNNLDKLMKNLAKAREKRNAMVSVMEKAGISKSITQAQYSCLSQLAHELSQAPAQRSFHRMEHCLRSDSAVQVLGDANRSKLLCKVSLVYLLRLESHRTTEKAEIIADTARLLKARLADTITEFW